MGNRNIRRLSGEEHTKTRDLYEQVFSEDSTAFVDYYYKMVASDNEIFVVEEEEKILSMLHLNPYLLKVGKREVKSYYVVAVATHPDYRHQGLMKSLIQEALDFMEKQGIPFTYLMPAKEAIYRPFGFRFISYQNQGELEVGEYIGKEKLHAYPATMADVPDLCWFSSQILAEKKAVYAKRTEAYYERLLSEQRCQGGDLAVLCADGQICGWFLTAEDGNRPAVREAVVEKEWEPLLFPTIADCFRYDQIVEISAFPENLALKGAKKVPLLMGRIVKLETYLSLVQESIPEGFTFSMEDPLLKENQGWFQMKGGMLHRLPGIGAGEVFMPETFLERFPLPDSIFLNELV